MVARLVAFLLLFWGSSATGVPEVARFGHFTCVSCHVAPSGGGALTSYGRTFAAEKLSTWSFEDEERPFHGLVPMSDTLLLGGDARWVSYRTDSGSSSFEKFWRMQTDLEASVHLRQTWLTAVAGTKPAGPTTQPQDSNHLVVRGYAARVDFLAEHLMIRGGLFTPKYGLMLADHTALVRSALGLGPDTEQTQLEAIYQDDAYEVTLAALIRDDNFERKGKSKSGFSAGAALFLADRHRLNAHGMQTQLAKDGSKTTQSLFGVSGVIVFTKQIFGLFEIDRVATNRLVEEETSTRTDTAAFSMLSWEVFKGVIPYGRLEYLDSDQVGTRSSTQKWGGGVNWYMRPHIQMDARGLRAIFSATHTVQDEGTLVLHYYF